MNIKKTFCNDILATLALIILSVVASAQSHTINNKQQLWFGYMTSTTLSERYSWWNDFHVVPESFAIVRTGITRHFRNTTLTTGYAYAWLSPGHGITKLQRQEHRPWGQIQFNLPVSHNFTLTQRIRYDARFRERLVREEAESNYAFNHRVRTLISAKRKLNIKLPGNAEPYVSISNEVLLNFGKEITYNTFDQNRLSFSVGVQHGPTQYQIGYMNRFVQTGQTDYTSNHTLTMWVTQKLDFRSTGE